MAVAVRSARTVTAPRSYAAVTASRANPSLTSRPSRAPRSPSVAPARPKSRMRVSLDGRVAATEALGSALHERRACRQSNREVPARAYIEAIVAPVQAGDPRRALASEEMTEIALNDRQVELARTFVTAWERSGHVPFDLRSDRPFAHPAWPCGVRSPDRDEVRSLCSLDMLNIDDAPSRGAWRVYPSDAARLRFGDGSDQEAAKALSDPDRRLGFSRQQCRPLNPIRLNRCTYGRWPGPT